MIKPTRTVDRDLWGDDDIFVRVDIRDGVSDKKIGETPLQACSDVGAPCSLFVCLFHLTWLRSVYLAASGLGKAKYLFDTKKHATSFVLLE